MTQLMYHRGDNNNHESASVGKAKWSEKPSLPFKENTPFEGQVITTNSDWMYYNFESAVDSVWE